MAQGDWKDQYKRMMRWRRRLDEARGDPYLLQDSFFAFFVNCYHLADWLKLSSPHCNDAIDHANGHPYLGLCRGISNGSKHFALTQKHDSPHYRTFFPSSTTGEWLKTSSTGCSDSVPTSDIPVCEPERCFVQARDGRYELFSLADDCIDSWNEYLRNKGLTPPASF